MKKIWLTGAVCCALACSSLVGCDSAVAGGKYSRYADAGFSVGDGSVRSVSSIEVDWVAGDIRLEISDSATEVSFFEEGTGGEELALRYRAANGELDIRYAASLATLPKEVSKDLTIVLPASLGLREVEVDSVDSKIVLVSVSADSLSVDTVAGSVELDGGTFGELSVDSVSAEISLEGCSFREADIDTASGDVEISLQDVGFTCKFDTLSGDFRDDFGAVRRGSTYTYGNGAAEIEVDTVSGDLALKKASDRGEQGGGTTNPGGEQGGGTTTPGGEQGGGTTTPGGEQGGGTTTPGGEQGGGTTTPGGEQGGGTTNPGGEQGGGTTTPGGQTSGQRYEYYENASRYTAGGGTVQNIRSVEIEWIGGEVKIASSPDATGVTFAETAGNAASEQLLHYRVEQGELKIEYVGSGAYLPVSPKNLTVTVPASRLDEIDVENRNGNVSFENVDVWELSADTLSGGITVKNCTFLDGNFETTAGDIALYLQDVGFHCEFETLSGEFYDEFGARRAGHDYLYGDGSVDIDVETRSGNLSLYKTGSDTGSGGGGTQPSNPEEDVQGRYDYYENAASYTAGGGFADRADAIEIDWMGGEVKLVVSASATRVSFSETADSSDPGQLLHYRTFQGVLKIKYAGSGAKLPATPKTLTVTLPVGEIGEIDIENDTGDITVEGVNAVVLELDSGRGDITVKDCSFFEGSFDTGSGNIELYLKDVGFHCKFETYTGQFHDEFGARLIGHEYIYGNGYVEIEAETHSGDLFLKKL